MKKIQEVSEDTLKIEALFSTASEGEYFSYKDIELETGVKMDTAGKGYMRTALERLRLPKAITRGQGITLLSRDNALMIVVDKVVRVDNSIRRAAKTNKQVSIRMYDKLTEGDQKKINFIGATLGTVLAVASKTKNIFVKEMKRVSNNI